MVGFSSVGIKLTCCNSQTKNYNSSFGRFWIFIIFFSFRHRISDGCIFSLEFFLSFRHTADDVGESKINKMVKGMPYTVTSTTLCIWIGSMHHFDDILLSIIVFMLPTHTHTHTRPLNWQAHSYIKPNTHQIVSCIWAYCPIGKVNGIRIENIPTLHLLLLLPSKQQKQVELNLRQIQFNCIPVPQFVCVRACIFVWICSHLPILPCTIWPIHYVIQ